MTKTCLRSKEAGWWNGLFSAARRRVQRQRGTGLEVRRYGFAEWVDGMVEGTTGPEPELELSSRAPGLPGWRGSTKLPAAASERASTGAAWRVGCRRNTSGRTTPAVQQVPLQSPCTSSSIHVIRPPCLPGPQVIRLRHDWPQFASRQ